MLSVQTRRSLHNFMRASYIVLTPPALLTSLIYRWGSRQPGNKPAVPPKPQSFQSPVALPTRRNVALRVSLASEGSGAVETVVVSNPTVRNGSCGKNRLFSCRHKFLRSK